MGATGYKLLRCVLAPVLEDQLMGVAVAESGGELLGSETRTSGEQVEVLLYFDADTSLTRLRKAVSGLNGIELRDCESVPERDWLCEYRRSAQPIRVGGFLFDPREPDSGAPASADKGVVPIDVDSGSGSEPRRLKIPARQAFGTGSHASTALLVELLERRRSSLHGARVLDVGTGTGILSFVALSLGAGTAVGLDCDPRAVVVAVQNCRLNALAPRLLAGTTGALSDAASFDMIVANVIPEQLRSEEPRLARLLAPGGELLVSGVLSARASQVAASWRRHGLEVTEAHGDGEWTALALAHEGTGGARRDALRRAEVAL